MAKFDFEQTIRIQSEITVKYNTADPKFIEAVKGYKEVINSNGDDENMILYIVGQLARLRDFRKMIEGVGYVKLNGHVQDESLYCGVEIDTDDPLWDVDFTD